MTAATKIARYRNGRNSAQGDMPAAFITINSESFDSRPIECITAIMSAIGAITSTSIGMIRPVMPRKTSTVWPRLVIRSMSRKRLGDPDHRGQAEQDDGERTEGGAEDVTVDRAETRSIDARSPAKLRHAEAWPPQPKLGSFNDPNPSEPMAATFPCRHPVRGSGSDLR